MSNNSMDWVDNGEDDFFQVVESQIDSNKLQHDNKIKEVSNYVIDILNNIDVSFEPDPSYRSNVKNIIIGLVICQLLRQRTINIYRKGKEDREYLASFLMYVIQKYLYNNIKVTEWTTILSKVYDNFKTNVKFPGIEEAIVSRININKIIPENILLNTLVNNKKEYIRILNKNPPSYI